VLFNEDLAVEGDEVVVFELTNVTGDCITDVASELLEYTIMDDDQLSINNLAEAGIDIYSAENIIMFPLQILRKMEALYSFSMLPANSYFLPELLRRSNNFPLAILRREFILRN
jgi:hypothetical protein